MRLFGGGKSDGATADGAPEAAAVAPTGVRRALVTACDRYRNVSNLSLCEADATEAVESVVTFYQYESPHMRMLLNERMTCDALEERLTWLTEGLEPGDEILWWHSGHGGQVATRDYAGEPDGLDEVLITHDFDWDDACTWFLDDHINGAFGRVPAGVQCNIVMDTCHSGGMARGNPMPFKGVPRYVEPPADIAWRIQGARQRGVRLRRLVDANALNVGMLAACRADQTAAEDPALGHGALTYYMLKAIESGGPVHVPLADLRTYLASKLERGGYSQVPQCMGALVREPFLGRSK